MDTCPQCDATDDLITRRQPDEWSPLEYACHVRDMLLVQRDRLYVALVEDGPSFKPMYRDHRVAFDRYDAQRPDVVAAQLAMAGPLIYNFPAPGPRDVEWMAHHTVHELVHHLGDIDRLRVAL